MKIEKNTGVFGEGQENSINYNEVETLPEEFDDSDEVEMLPEQFDDSDKVEMLPEQFDDSDEVEMLPEQFDDSDEVEMLPEQFDDSDEVEKLPKQFKYGDEAHEATSDANKDLQNVDDALEADDNRENKDVNEEAQVVKNKREGCERENQVEEELKKKYPESEGYQIVKEAYLRDKDGNFVIDPETGKRRRIDFVVVKDGKVVESIEVTSMTAPKDEQMAKEKRIRDLGGNYIIDNNGNLVEFPSDVETRIERRP